MLKNMPPEEQLARIREGAKDPAAALGVVQHLSDKLTAEQTAALLDLDRELASNASPAARELAKAAIVALGMAMPPALPYVHEVFENAPDRRQDVAQALATFSLSRDRRDGRLAAAGPLAADRRRRHRPRRAAGLAALSEAERQAARTAAGDFAGPQAGRSGWPRCFAVAARAGPARKSSSRASHGKRRSPRGKSGSSKRIPISPRPCCRRSRKDSRCTPR